jgi:hydroxymethylbilane synthase
VLHNLRDLPARLPDEFHLAAITEREEAREALVTGASLRAGVKCVCDLPAQARVGVNSLRRRAQLQALRSDLALIDMSASLETRLRQLDEGEVDALIVAASSLLQLGEGARIAALLEPRELIPAASQGALALQTRLEDQRANLLLEALNHWPTRYATEAERAVVRKLTEHDAAPIAAYARVAANDESPQLVLTALAADAEGKRIVRAETSGELRDGEMLGNLLALDLLDLGADEFLGQASLARQIELDSLYPMLRAQQEDLALSAAAIRVNGAAEFVNQTPTGARPYEVSAFIAGTAEEFGIVAGKTRKAGEQKPFQQQRILIARATRNNVELVNTLEALGAEVVVCPTARASEPTSWDALDRVLLHLSWYDWITFASPHSVDYFLRRLRQLDHRHSEVLARRICAVGERTAEKLLAAGIQADLSLERFTAECLAEAVLKRYGVRERLRGATMLLLASQSMRAELRPALDKFGVYVEAVEAYRLALPETGSAEIVAELRAAEFDYVIFNGEASVENLASVLEPLMLPDFLAPTRVLCTNEAACAAAVAYGLSVDLQPSETGVGGLIRALREDCLAGELG